MKHYNSIDLLKFLMSFFVIAIHTAYDQVLLMRLICPWVVPMFFVISGFLLQRRISMQRSVEVCGKRVENLLGGVINSYIIKLVKLYILWTLLYLPLTFYGSCVVESNSLLRAFALFCRNVIFTGENHMSWPLWYLLALIWASFLVKIMLKWKMKVEWILISGLCLTLIGWGVKYVLETEHAEDCLEKIVFVYKKTFVGTRNGLFVGFGFVSVGMFLGKWQDYFLRHTVWSCWVAALSVAAFLYDLPFSTHLLCFCILLFVIRIRLADRKKAVSMVQTDEYVDLFLSHVFCCHFSISVSGSICRSAAICIGICVDILFQLYCHTAYGSSRIQFSEKTCWIINVPVSKLQISMI